MARNKKQKIREITVVYLSDMIQINDDVTETIGGGLRPKPDASEQEHKEFTLQVISLLQHFKSIGVTQVKEEKEAEERIIETVYDIDTYITNWQSA